MTTVTDLRHGDCVLIDRLRDLEVGDVLVEWARHGERPSEIFADVVAVDREAKEVRIRKRDTGELVTWFTDVKRNKGHNRIKRLRRQGEVLDWERGNPAWMRSVTYHEEAPLVEPKVVADIRRAFEGVPS